MEELLLTSILGIALIAICTVLTYEILRHIWGTLPALRSHPRQRVLLMVCAIFGAHIANIWIFGAAYYFLLQNGYGTFTGTDIDRGIYALDFMGCVYFSAVTYSTLGIGDITPEGAMRMITSVEALTGFILIGWTVSFTYLTMEKFWQLPHRKKARD